ncbi:SDR family NAD(P)-dependent oxidoreductase [Streptomyces krungchingensis]
MRNPVLERRNILITGASTGLGAGMAGQLASRGRNLALCARRTDRFTNCATNCCEPIPASRSPWLGST